MNTRIFEERGKILCFLLGVGFLLACGISKKDHDKVLQENINLKADITRLKAELDSALYGAPRLLEKAKIAFDIKDLAASKDSLEELLKRHPSSSEAEEAKSLLKNVFALINKEIKEKLEAEKKTIEIAARSMTKNFDEVRNLTFYKDVSTPLLGTHLYLYFSSDGKNAFGPFVYIQYEGDGWLFIEKYILKIDDETHEISPSYNEVTHNNSASTIWEVYNKVLSDDQLRFMRKIINSKKTILRFSGKDYYKDHVISQGEKTRMARVLNAYKAMGGTK